MTENENITGEDSLTVSDAVEQSQAFLSDDDISFDSAEEDDGKYDDIVARYEAGDEDECTDVSVEKVRESICVLPKLKDATLPSIAVKEEHAPVEFLVHPELLLNEEHDPKLFAHLADLHLAPRSGTIPNQDPYTGRLVRDMDMSAALHAAVDDILEQRPLPSACVVAGDIFDTWQASQDAIIDAAREFQRLRLAGIEVVAIAGNHDTPTQKKKTPAYIVLKHEFEDMAQDEKAHFAYNEIEHVKVGDVEYVLLPHNAAEHGGFTEEDFKPRLGAEKSVLVVHGVAAGDPSLAQQDEMKEIPIAKWLLDMPWDYIAFGHYHKPGWIPGYKGRAAYCGSLENTVISGPDVSSIRGPVYIDLSKSGEDMLVMHPQKIRRIMQLETLDFEGHDVDAEELDRLISQLILDSNVKGAIVTHTVKGIPRSVIRTMKRRSFQGVEPEVLHIKTVIEALTEVPVAMAVNEETGEPEPIVDPDTGEAVQVDVDGAQNFKPLAQEVATAINELVASGTIRETRKDNVTKILTSVFETKK